MDRSQQDALYREASAEFGPALRRLVRGYEADPEQQRDLLQEIHLELWKSLRQFDGRCSLRTWTYRVAHNTGASHVRRRRRARFVELEEMEVRPGMQASLSAATLLELIYGLAALDRQVILLYLEGESAAEIAAITGLTPGNVATKIHRIKRVLGERYATKGGTDGSR
ncbi:MAG: sigma-70 family RNA polymerase sigma factor [Bryobacteraceae bacterium]